MVANELVVTAAAMFLAVAKAGEKPLYIAGVTYLSALVVVVVVVDKLVVVVVVVDILVVTVAVELIMKDVAVVTMDEAAVITDATAVRLVEAMGVIMTFLSVVVVVVTVFDVDAFEHVVVGTMAGSFTVNLVFCLIGTTDSLLIADRPLALFDLKVFLCGERSVGIVLL